MCAELQYGSNLQITVSEKIQQTSFSYQSSFSSTVRGFYSTNAALQEEETKKERIEED